MCVHCKAASAGARHAMEDPRVREEFDRLGADLNTLGPLTHGGICSVLSQIQKEPRFQPPF